VLTPEDECSSELEFDITVFELILIDQIAVAVSHPEYIAIITQ